MAKKEVLDETKKVLELMCESEEKVAHLQANLTENKSLYQQMDDNFRELRQLLSKNEAELEDNQHLKINIKNWNQELICFAHQIYDYIQELHSNLNTHDTELLKNRSLLCKNDELLAKKLSTLKNYEKTLERELDLIENKGKESELEIKALTTENEELRAEIEMMDSEIKCCEEFITQEEKVLEEEKSVEGTIKILNSYIDANENDLIEITSSVEKTKEHKEKLVNDEKIKTSELEEEIKRYETVIEHTTLNVENYRFKCNETSEKKQTLENREKELKEEFCDLERQLNEIELNFKAFEDNKATIVNCENSSLQCDEMYKRQEDLKESLKSETQSLNSKVEHQQEVIQKINEFITSYKDPETDLKTEVESKQIRLKELKELRFKLKQDIVTQKAALEAALKSGQNEVEIIEQGNKKLEEDIENIISDMNQMKNEMAHTSMEKEEHTGRLKELSHKETILKQQIKQVKSDKSKKKRKRSDSGTIAGPSGKSASSNQKKLISWSSESSLEGVDTTLWDLARKNMKTKANTRK